MRRVHEDDKPVALTEQEIAAIREEARDDEPVSAPPEDCAGCKRGGRCAIHGAAKKRKPAATPAVEPERAPAPPGRFDAAIPRTEIRRSPFNHRTFFAGLNELADSIRAHGILNPLIVRPAPLALQTGKKSGKVDPAKYELVAGERRWRAAELADLELVPCIVRELSDVEVLEIQLIENVQRADVHPLEEATGYRDLMEHHGYTAETIARKTGKSKAYVYARLKLCELPPVAREALASDRLNASIALLIARIPSERHQVWATREVLRIALDDLSEEDCEREEADEAGRAHLERLDRVEMDAPRVGSQNPSTRGAHEATEADHKALPMSVREAQAHLQRNYMTRLELAKFQLDDATLVPEVGACTKCVHRTGNQPELFSDVKRADVCTNPPCFDRKNRAAFAQLASELDEGIKVLDQDQAKEARVFSHYDGTSITGNSPYVEPDEPVPWTLLPANQSDKRPTWEKLLGKKGLAKVERVVAQDGTGAARQLITQADAVRLLREEGKLPKPEKKKSSSGTARGGQDWAAQEEKRKAKAEITARAVLKAVQSVTVDARNMVKALRVVARQLGELAENGDAHEMIAALAGGDQKPKRGGGRKYVTAGLVEKAADIYDLAELALRFALVDVAGPRYGGGIQPEGVAALKEIGVDWSKVYDAEVAAAKAAEKAKKAEAKTAAKGKPAKKGASKR